MDYFKDIKIDQQLITNGYCVIGFVAIIWLVEIVNLISGRALGRLGLFPRRISGLPGVIFSPFLHNGIAHVALNTIPMLVLGGLAILINGKLFVETSIFIIIAAGAALWLLGRPVRHAGASLLIFGYFGFLASNGLVDRTVMPVVVSIATVLLYGGILWLAAPTRKSVSWEGHLFGLIAGVFAALRYWEMPDVFGI